MLEPLLSQPVSFNAARLGSMHGSATLCTQCKDAWPRALHRAPIPEEEPIPGEEPEPEEDPVPHPDPVIREPDLPSSAPMSLMRRRSKWYESTGSEA